MGSMLTEEMKDWFEKRTDRHVNLVLKYINIIAELDMLEISRDGLFDEIENHDAGKWVEPEYTPYVHITWKYKQESEGLSYEPPEDIEAKMKEATYHHVINHLHHPEFWDEMMTPDMMNQNDRHKPSGRIVDATMMPPTAIACMIADWFAVSEEKNTKIEDWLDMNVNVRWKFDQDQIDLMKQLITKVQKD